MNEQVAHSDLAVLVIPMGSPGMEGPRKDAYKVLIFTSDGDSSIFSQY